MLQSEAIVLESRAAPLLMAISISIESLDAHQPRVSRRANSSRSKRNRRLTSRRHEDVTTVLDHAILRRYFQMPLSTRLVKFCPLDSMAQLDVSGKVPFLDSPVEVLQNLCAASVERAPIRVGLECCGETESARVYPAIAGHRNEHV